MAASKRLETGPGVAAVGIVAVFCSVVGLQLGWMTMELLGERNAVPAVLLAGGGIALGFLLCSRRNWFFEKMSKRMSRIMSTCHLSFSWNDK